MFDTKQTKNTKQIEKCFNAKFNDENNLEPTHFKEFDHFKTLIVIYTSPTKI